VTSLAKKTRAYAIAAATTWAGRARSAARKSGTSATQASGHPCGSASESA
jgi:hypothetical protein